MRNYYAIEERPNKTDKGRRATLWRTFNNLRRRLQQVVDRENGGRAHTVLIRLYEHARDWARKKNLRFEHLRVARGDWEPLENFVSLLSPRDAGRFLGMLHAFLHTERVPMVCGKLHRSVTPRAHPKDDSRQDHPKKSGTRRRNGGRRGRDRRDRTIRDQRYGGSDVNRNG